MIRLEAIWNCSFLLGAFRSLATIIIILGGEAMFMSAFEWIIVIFTAMTFIGNTIKTIIYIKDIFSKRK
jgi:hypothetical protein